METTPVLSACPAQPGFGAPSAWEAAGNDSEAGPSPGDPSCPGPIPQPMARCLGSGVDTCVPRRHRQAECSLRAGHCADRRGLLSTPQTSTLRPRALTGVSGATWCQVPRAAVKPGGGPRQPGPPGVKPHVETGLGCKQCDLRNSLPPWGPRFFIYTAGTLN